MDISSLVGAQLLADNQPVFDPDELGLAMRRAEERRERWRKGFTRIRSLWSMLRCEREPSAKLVKTATAE